ncbi:hypothetical protein VTK56DRAFT_571 [Thermocarpiscus australiensis]
MATTSSTTPRIISMEFSDGRDNSFFRILAETRVKYITILPGALDPDALSDMPLDFMNILPPLPYYEDTWTAAHISRDAVSGELKVALSSPAPPRVENVWHSELIDFLRLEKNESLSPLTGLYTWESDAPQQHSGETVIAKMARFEWEIPYIEQETRIYQRLEGTGIAPLFLGHIHEQGRVIGFLLERVEGRFAGIEDLAGCRAALARLHQLNILHGDVNRYNFIVGGDGRVTLIDFEKSREGAGGTELEAKMASLEEQLKEETGRGGGFMSWDEEEDDD